MRNIGYIFIVAGIFIFMSPDMASLYQSLSTQFLIYDFENRYGDYGIKDLSDKQQSDDGRQIDMGITSSQIEQDTEKIAENGDDSLYQTISDYNRSIYIDGQSELTDPWSYTQSPVDISGLDDGIFGYIEIPALNQSFILYIGASLENMSKGVAVMGQTSFPVGGQNTNCVIAGHRGYNSQKTFFRYIENVQVGDKIYVTNPWETLIYEAETIDIIDPSDVDAVRIQEGKDMITLLTCHPYRSGGQYRYLVYCVRCGDEEETDDNTSTVHDIINVANSENQYIFASDGNFYEHSSKDIQIENTIRRLYAFGMMFLMAVIVYKRLRERQYQNKENRKDADQKTINSRRGIF